ncbi:RNA-guided endonuclease TnpB family protein [Spirillospora sp. NPDC029432]|uniref:RNA-guided endonuclease InsQ/TnpB family protein n=1 Tax=Spirillospora sp. NPDC029432 TaxID=3154599 RepID=UPI0034539417
MRLRYNYRIYPTCAQRRALARAFGCARVVFNDGLALRNAAYEAGLPYISDAALSRQVITQAKKSPARAWLAEVSAVALQQALADLNAAYRNFFESITGHRRGPKVEPPKPRSRKSARQAIRLTRAGFRLRSNGRLYAARIGEISVRWSRPLTSEPTSVTIIKDSAGRYFASFVVDVETSPLPMRTDEVGIDLGLTSFAVLSTGHKVASPQYLRRAEKRLQSAQRVVARRQEGSNNRAKAERRLARRHAKVADARRDFLHKLSTGIVRDNQAVYVENLAVKGLARGRLSKSVHDAGWATFVAMLEYKAERAGRYMAKIGRFEPTSQVCSACGVKDGPKPLSVRSWTCVACGAEHDRDHNAALNILAAGRADRLNVCGGRIAVRGGPALETETSRVRTSTGQVPALDAV